DKEKISTLLPSEAIELAASVTKQLRAFHGEIERAWRPDPSDRDPLWRAPNGVLPSDWAASIDSLGEDTKALFNWVNTAHQMVSKSKQEDAAKERLQRNLGMALDLVEQQHALWTGWRREDKEGQPPM